METYKPSAEPHRLVLSNTQYALLKEFYNKGLSYRVDEKQAKFLDQRSFDPAYARGLFAWDGSGFYMTLAGRAFVESYEGRTAWKEHSSNQFSHYIKTLRVVRANSGRFRREAHRQAGVRAVGA